MSSELGAGTVLGGCRIESVARRGATGVVYRATRVADARTVALEVISPDLAGAAGYSARFERSTRLAASISHPNVLPVLEASHEDGRLFVVTGWVDASDLGTRLSESGPLSGVEAIRTLRPVASALAAAHRRGLIHGDVRPANVLIGEADVFLTDFGLGGERPAYPVPEGGPQTASGDIYAFGCMLYATLTGRTLPDETPTGPAAALETPAGRVPSPQAELDGPLREIVELATASDPADRFGSAEELALALEAARAQGRSAPLAPVPQLDRAKAQSLRVQAPVPASASAPAADQLETPWASRHSTVIFAAVAVALAALLITVLATSKGFNTTTTGTPISARAQVKTVTTTAATTPPVAAAAPATVTLGRMSVLRVMLLSAPAGGLAVSPGGVAYASVPSRNQLVEVPPGGGPREAAPGSVPDPGPIAASSAGVWVADPAADSVSFVTGRGKAGGLRLSGRSVAVAAASNPMKGWVAVAGGTVTKLGAQGGATTALVARQVAPGITGFAIQVPKWVWAAAPGGLFRINANDVTSQGVGSGSAPTGVAFDNDVWTSHSSGLVTELDPGDFHVASSLQLPAPLTAIAATPGAAFVWALSGPARTLYEITTAHPHVVGTVTFGSTPTAVAVTHLGVWVTTANGDLIRIGRT